MNFFSCYTDLADFFGKVKFQFKQKTTLLMQSGFEFMNSFKLFGLKRKLVIL